MLDDTIPRRPQLIILLVSLAIALTLIAVSVKAEGGLQLVLRGIGAMLVPLAGIVYPLILWRRRKGHRHRPG